MKRVLLSRESARLFTLILEDIREEIEAHPAEYAAFLSAQEKAIRQPKRRKSRKNPV